MKSLSFIIPVYNGEKYITRCLKSIFLQAYPHIEIIIINDGSYDKSLDYINKAISLYNKKSFNTTIINQKNLGVAAARNIGIQKATSDYIAFIDQDDYISKDFCTTYMSAVDSTDYDMVIGGFRRINPAGRQTRYWIPKDLPWTKFCLTYPWGRIIKRSFLMDNSIAFLKTGIGEDVYFDLVCYSYTNNIKMLSNAMYVWFDNPKSVSNTEYTFINDKINPLYTFDSIEADMCSASHIPSDYIEYYYIKFIVWYLLSSVRNSKKADLLSARNQMFTWLSKRYPNYKSNPNISVFKLKGDSLKNNLCVYMYMLLHRIKLDRLLLSLLGKK